MGLLSIASVGVAAPARAAVTAGTLVAWGTNYSGVTNVPSGSFTVVAAGAVATHNLAIRTDGSLAAWGDNTYGQRDVSPGTFIAVAAGMRHGAAIRTDGTLAAWGDNTYGQRDVPSGNFTAVSAGETHSVAIRTDGTLAAWGDNTNLQLNVPPGAFTTVSAGAIHSVAIKADGTLAAWGSNVVQQLNVPSGTFIAVAASIYSSVAIRTNGTLVAWGTDMYGQLTNVPSGTFTAVAAGAYHYVAVRTDGTLVAWGNVVQQQNVPSGTFTAVAAGAGWSVALRSSEYVALGDSFQSGEGAGSYWPDTDSAMNHCHRSKVAYPELLAESGAFPTGLAFGACSGATTSDADLASPSAEDSPPYDDGVSQYGRLSPATKLVTVGIGGNDVDFAGALTRLVLGADLQHEQLALDDRLKRLVSGAFGGLSPLRTVYHRVREKAPNARVMVIGYPRFYPTYATTCVSGLFNRTAQEWINYNIRRLNAFLKAASAKEGAEFVDVYDVFAGHELCTSIPALNGFKPLSKVESFHPNAFGQQLLASAVERAYSQGSAPTVTVQQGAASSLDFTVSVSGSVTFRSAWPGSDVVMSLRSPSGRAIDRDTAAGDVEHFNGPTFEVFTVTDPEPGEWSVSLFGANVDPAGEATTLSVFEEPITDEPPVAQIKVTQSGRSVSVDASGSTDTDGTISSFDWDFGDGATASGPTASHTYAADGPYNIGLAVTDNAGGMRFAWSGVTVTGDTTGPVITWLGAIDDLAVFDFGQVLAAPTCTATDEESGVNDDGCLVSGFSTSVGAHILEATATDHAGNTTTEDRSYTISPWTLKGFFSPVEASEARNRVKAGSALPLKFQVFRGEVELTDTAVVKDIAVQQITCDETHSAIGDPMSLSGLLYIDSQFHLNWKTPRIAEACYRATVTAQDDSTLNAVLQLK